MPMESGEEPPARLRRLPTRLLTQTAAHAGRLVLRGLGEFRTHHYALMSALEEVGPSSQAELGRRCAMDRSDVVAAVDELAGRGCVLRSPDPADRRRNTVSLTAEGESVLRLLDERVQRIQDEVFAPLSAEERTLLAELLARVLDHHAGIRRP